MLLCGCARKAQRENGDVTPLLLNLGTRWRSVVRPEQVEMFWRLSFSPAKIRTLDHPACSLVTIPCCSRSHYWLYQLWCACNTGSTPQYYVNIIEHDKSLLTSWGSQTFFKSWKFKFCMPVTQLPKIKSSSDPMLYTEFINLNILYAKMKQFIFPPIKKSAYITWNILRNCVA